jgi:hypothetical protein
MSTKLPRRVRPTYEFIKAHRQKHPIAWLMREHQLRALHGDRMRRWSVGKSSVLIPNLLKRQFTVTRRNKGMGDGDHLHSDVAGPALPSRRHGPVLPQDRRLVSHEVGALRN